MSTLRAKQCKGCFKTFTRPADVLRHQKQAKLCRWVHEERQAQAPALARNLTDFDNLASDPPQEGSDPILPMDHFTFAPSGDDSPLPAKPRNPLLSASPEAPPSLHAPARRAAAEESRQTNSYFAEEYPGAGHVYGESVSIYAEYQEFFGGSQNPFHPFKTELEWEIAHWAKDTQQGENTFTKLLAIPGVIEKLGLSFNNSRALNQIIDHELPDRAAWRKVPLHLDSHEDIFYLYHCDPMECLHALWSNPALCQGHAYAPEKHFSDHTKNDRVYNEMYTGDWWWKTQLKLPDGATVVPLIFSTDKTQLSVFSGDNTAYPVYMTIGNIDKATHRKPSSHAQILIGYLPTVDFDGQDLSSSTIRMVRARLFHHAMEHILKPLVQAGQEGVRLTGSDGKVRDCYPILACYVADYPEQCLVTCTRYGEADLKCGTCKQLFGSNADVLLRDSDETLEALQEAESLRTAAPVDTHLKSFGLSYIPRPFWQNLPHCNIHEAITPDILHQLYQGLIKHLLEWIESIAGAAELDAQIKRMPRAHGLHLFKDGITGLTRVSGPERKAICQQLLGCLVDLVPPGAVRAMCALLDFLYLAQYQSHSTQTLQYLQTVLDDFHKEKEVFIRLGVRDSV